MFFWDRHSVVMVSEGTSWNNKICVGFMYVLCYLTYNQGLPVNQNIIEIWPSALSKLQELHFFFNKG